jgi:integrase/recombinase XerD
MIHLPIHNDSFLNLFYEFKDLLRTKGFATVDMRMGRLREFLFFAESKGINDVKEVKATDIIAYCEYLKERPNERRGGGLSEITIKGHLATLGIFFDYLTDAGYRASSPIRFPRFGSGKYNERELLSVDEIKKVYSVCANKRERAIISLAYGCGMRRTEIENLNTSDISFNKGILTVREGKGNKSRIIPLSDTVAKDLREYLIYERERYMKQGVILQAFLINDMGQRLLGANAQTFLKRILQRTRIKKHITLHCLRHSLATHLLDMGAEIEFVKGILGHRRIDTTHLYSKKRKQRYKIMQSLRPNGSKN